MFDVATYVNMYNREHYDRVNVMMAKGEKVRLKNEAAEMGMSLNRYLTMCIDKGREVCKKSVIKN